MNEKEQTYFVSTEQLRQLQVDAMVCQIPSLGRVHESGVITLCCTILRKYSFPRHS